MSFCTSHKRRFPCSETKYHVWITNVDTNKFTVTSVNCCNNIFRKEYPFTKRYTCCITVVGIRIHVSNIDLIAKFITYNWFLHACSGSFHSFFTPALIWTVLCLQYKWREFGKTEISIIIPPLTNIAFYRAIKSLFAIKRPYIKTVIAVKQLSLL